MEESRIRGYGCINCPVAFCDTLRYRGSRCSILRDMRNLGDPLTQADKLIAGPLRQLAEYGIQQHGNCWHGHFAGECATKEAALDCEEKWLLQPKE